MYKALWFSLLLLGIGSCQLIGIERGNGQIESEKRQLGSFSEIHLTGNFELVLKSGPKNQLIIVTDENLLDYIETEIDNRELQVRTDKKLQSDHGIKLFVTYQELNKILSAGASIIKSDGPIKSERLELNIPGASLVDLQLDVGDLDVMLAGAGSVKLRGKASNQILSLNGVGHVEASELESRWCEVTVSGMGEAEVNVKENLVARVNGVGSINYRGNPENVDEKVSGLGTIRPATDERNSKTSETI